MKFRSIIIFSLVLAFFISSTAIAQVEIGGEVKTTTINSNDKNNLRENLNLQLFLPKSESTSAKFEFNISKISTKNKIQTSLKKLYIKHRFDNFDLTLGRQPISWSFGSLLNPVDFNLGAEAMEEETSAKNTDALELYLPINWNSSLTLVTSFKQNGDVKSGLRGRTNFKGYDVSLNYVQAVEETANSANGERIGLSTKGDLGPIGVYSAVSYYLDQKEQVYLLGGDYSFYPGRNGNRLVVQLEYLRDEAGALNNILNMYSLLSDNEESTLTEIKIGPELVLSRINYKIDEFSSVSLMGGINLEDSSLIMIPEYKNQLNSNLDFTLSGSILVGKDKILGLPEVDVPSKKVIELSLSYPF